MKTENRDKRQEQETNDQKNPPYIKKIKQNILLKGTDRNLTKGRKDRHIYHLLQRDTKREWLGKNRYWIKRTRDRNYTHTESERKWSLKQKSKDAGFV